MRQNFISQLIQLLKCWLYNLQSGVEVKNWALSVDQCQPQALQFSVHLINLLSILLRCNSFSGIQKTVVDQTISKPQKSDHYLFSGASWVFAKTFGAASLSNYSAGHFQLYKFHFLSHVTVWSRNGSLLLSRVRKDNTSKQLFDLWSAHEVPSHRGFSHFQFPSNAE